MTEEPYRWLEAIGNRREYVREQLKGGSPAFAVKLPDGILTLAVGSGQSKVFELFDRHALAALGHPADIEKIRQAAIDAAHMEAFTRAPEDVSLRRLVSFGLSPQLKTNFEQIFSAPFLIEMLLMELGNDAAGDVVVRLHFDGAFQIATTMVTVAAAEPEREKAAQDWLNKELAGASNRKAVVEKLLQAWFRLIENKEFSDETAVDWKSALQDKVVEIGWLDRATNRQARYVALTMADVGLAEK
jgi:proteasome alpha subunit